MTKTTIIEKYLPPRMAEEARAQYLQAGNSILIYID